MEIINTVLGMVLFIGLPVFFVVKLYGLLVKTLSFHREQKEKMNNKEIQYLELQMLECQQRIDFYKKADCSTPSRVNDSDKRGGGRHGNYQKDNNRDS
jgi:hypothetical protein